MSSAKIPIKGLNRNIKSVEKLLEEIRACLSYVDKEGKLGDVLERTETCRKELDGIKSKVHKIKEFKEANQFIEEVLKLEENCNSDKDKVSEYVRSVAERFKETKTKWEITIDAMMIIGKYFQTSKDYINVMKTAKKYHDLVQMYHFNPIPDCSLFINMESQYFYKQE